MACVPAAVVVEIVILSSLFTHTDAVCDSACTECMDPATCIACRPGYHVAPSGTCMECPATCATCTDDTLCQTCIDGYYGNTCQNGCQETCTTCTDLTSCQACETGYYGDFCQRRCYLQCRDRVCSQDTGHCAACQDGFFGPFCSVFCPANCLTCLSHEECLVCQDGYFGLNCRNRCPSNCSESKCEKVTGRCLSCNDGYYGDTCQSSCPSNCKVCSSASSCTNCAPGYFGLSCSNDCKADCQVCTDENTCAVCKPGHFLLESDCSKCQDGCQMCTSVTNCSSCFDGYFLNDTTCLPCDPRCTENQCHQDGVCTSGCVPGLYGTYCDKECGDVLTNCSNCLEDNMVVVCLLCDEGSYIQDGQCVPCPLSCSNRHCDPVDGTCLEGCVDPFYGTKCDLLCSPNCVSGECSQESDHCVGGCTDGYWGANCKSTCASFCEVCQQDSGKCVRCQAGRYGTDCLLSCSSYCAWRDGVIVCQINNGSCLNGCEPGFHGHSCHERCDENCKGGNCRRQDGHCLYGCLLGFQGARCDEEVSEKDATSESDLSTLLYAVLACLLLFAFAILAIIAAKAICRRLGIQTTCCCHNRVNQTSSRSRFYLTQNAQRRPSFECLSMTELPPTTPYPVQTKATPFGIQPRERHTNPSFNIELIYDGNDDRVAHTVQR